MDRNPLVSVILPTFNRAHLLERAINSVLAQTYTNWELIIWDDGSTDGTADLINSIQDDRIRYEVGRKNIGVAAARNKALALASGELIAFLDSDDEYALEKLNAQVDALDNHPEIDIIFSDFANINQINGSQTRAFEEHVEILQMMEVDRLSENLYGIKTGFLNALATENIIATDSIMFRAKLLDHPPLFNEDLQSSEDFALWWRWGLSGSSFAWLDAVLLNRYKTADSLSLPNRNAFTNKLKSLDYCSALASEMGKQDSLANLDVAYNNCWQNMIILHGYEGNLSQIFKAFFKTFQYGFSIGSFRLLIRAILQKFIRRDQLG